MVMGRRHLPWDDLKAAANLASELSGRDKAESNGYEGLFIPAEVGRALLALARYREGRLVAAFVELTRAERQFQPEPPFGVRTAILSTLSIDSREARTCFRCSGVATTGEGPSASR